MTASPISSNNTSGMLATQPNSNIGTSRFAEKKVDSSEYTKSTLQTASTLPQTNNGQSPNVAGPRLELPDPMTFLKQELGPQHSFFAAPGKAEGLDLPEGRHVGKNMDGKPHGWGVLTYHSNDPLGRSKYEGAFVQGKRQGDGVLRWVNGNKYDGEWRDDNFNGRGEWSSNVCKYRGDFVNGKFHGEGVRIDSDGTKWEGAFQNGLVHGKAEQTSANGAYVYKGKFEQNVKCGQGELTAPGMSYKGKWKDDKFEGKGALMFGNGSFCKSGDFKNGELWEGELININSGAIQKIRAGKVQTAGCIIL